MLPTQSSKKMIWNFIYNSVLGLLNMGGAYCWAHLMAYFDGFERIRPPQSKAGG